MPYLLTSTSMGVVTLTRLLQLLPPFGLYCGLFELSQYSFVAGFADTEGLTLAKVFSASQQGGIMWTTLVIFAVEIPCFLLLLVMCNNWPSPGPAATRILSRMLHPLSTANNGQEMGTAARASPSTSCSAEDRQDVLEEEARAEQLLQDTTTSLKDREGYGVLLCKLRKEYSAGWGNRPKLACESLSLCLQHGECFGLLGPNGAGKTTAIHMMVGLIRNDGGKGLVAGHDIETEMSRIHGEIGVCLQHDCLWSHLTGPCLCFDPLCCPRAPFFLTACPEQHRNSSDWLFPYAPM